MTNTYELLKDLPIWVECGHEREPDSCQACNGYITYHRCPDENGNEDLRGKCYVRGYPSGRSYPDCPGLIPDPDRVKAYIAEHEELRAFRDNYPVCGCPSDGEFIYHAKGCPKPTVKALLEVVEAAKNALRPWEEGGFRDREWADLTRCNKLPYCPCQDHIDTYTALAEALSHLKEGESQGPEKEAP